MGTLAYLKNMMTDRNIASITPTSRFGIERLARKMDFPSTKTIVEYGPATGVITKRLLTLLPDDAKLIAIDTNANFLNILRKNISDPRLHIVHDSAEQVLQYMEANEVDAVDYIISGIPFSFLPPEVADRIVANTKRALRNEGKFLVYQFLKPEKDTNLGIHRYLPKHFSNITKETEFLNVPPLRIYEAVKES